MAFIMGLEGPRLRSLDGLRGELYMVMPRPVHRVAAELRDAFDQRWFGVQRGPAPTAQFFGVLDPFTLHPIILIGGIFFGAWLGGTTRGQSLVRKLRRK